MNGGGLAEPSTPAGSIVDVPGVRIGHASDREGITGCTVALFPHGAVGGVDVRGSAPGTRDTDALRPTGLAGRIDGFVLTGGSVFGLGAVDGVLRYLAEAGVGLPTGVRNVPLVPAAVIFDLGVGDATAFPGPEMGYAAAAAADMAAAAGLRPEEGSVGVGTGATVGKLGPLEGAMKGGVGTASMRLPSGANVGALVVTNAVGDVLDRAGRIIAGLRAGPSSRRFVDAVRMLLRDGIPARMREFGNTTLAIIATDARLDRAETTKLAQTGHDALAISIRPVHTLWDGDTVFAASVGEVDEHPAMVGVAAVEVLREAIERSVRAARGVAGIPGHADPDWRSDAR